MECSGAGRIFSLSTLEEHGSQNQAEALVEWGLKAKNVALVEETSRLGRRDDSVGSLEAEIQGCRVGMRKDRQCLC